ncbi:hypothetical protein [Catellatospora sp. NPDC049133]|uniref:hypothetical protein n=1 Tax=Catellatospora sp. NPDC049133 TaxID=3155499 RepID=UPI00340B2B46
MHPSHLAVAAQAWAIMGAAESTDDRSTLVWAAGAARLTHVSYFRKAWYLPIRPSQERAAWEMWEQGRELAPGRFYRGTNYFEVASTTAIGFGPVYVRVPWTACAALMRTADPAWREVVDAHCADSTRDGHDIRNYELGWQIWQTLRPQPPTRQLDLFAALMA